MIVKIFSSPHNYTIKDLYRADKDEYLIGVDRGAYFAIQEGLKLDRAIGDFDSVTEEEFAVIKDRVSHVEKFSSHKDETDTFLAIKVALSLPAEEIIVFGGIGDRFDHTYANIQLLKLGNIRFVTDNEVIFMLDPGKYTIENVHRFISFFAIEDVKHLSLSNFEYPLENYQLRTDDARCISNKGSGNLSFSKGVLLVIMTNDK